jgi:acyl dehydratase
MAAEPEGYLFFVDATSIMLFASAIGETNKIYYDAEFAAASPLGQVIAPPTFPIAAALWNPSYPLRGIRRIPERAKHPDSTTSAGSEASDRPARPAGKSDADPGGSALARGLHGEQRFQYHQPLVPGMKLRVTTRRGKSWEKQGRRGGVMSFSETITEYRNEDGEKVVTATSVGITTSKRVEG